MALDASRFGLSFPGDSTNTQANMFRNLSNSEEQGPIDIKTNTPGGLKSSNPGADALNKYGLEYIQQTAPLRQNLADRSNAFLTGGLDVTQSPMYAALKGATEQQYTLAKNNIIGRTPVGGALTSALADADLQKANLMTQGIGSLAQDELGRASSLATGGLQLGGQGLSQSGAIQAELAKARAQERSAVISGKGQAWGGAGSAMGGK